MDNKQQITHGEQIGHVIDDITTLKGQGHDPKIFGGYYLETPGDTASVTTEARLRKLYMSAKNADEGEKQSATFKVRNEC